ncbi:hypothetical protein BKA70DRAFT_1203730 [Coprinopsis sp. MPI-PUGE-AT-0042]|nr:hypothetical protein BKA70DRAFT_1203730 [Coprinopsis sp. MPI-PUGE-AT-0042]
MYFTFNDGKVKPKPDFVFYKAGPSGRIPIHKPQGNFFALVQRPGEFKKRHRSAKRIKLGPRKAASVSLATIPESGPSQTSPAIVNTASESKPVTDIAAPSTTQASAASDRASTGSKRKASESIATDERGEEPVSRLVSGVAADTGLTQDQAQLAVYAMACLSSNSRVYTTGLFVESWKVTTFYFDHMSILQCESFDFRAKPAWFAILIYAMHCSDNQNLGHLRFLRPWSRLEEKITEQMKEDLLYPVARMEGSLEPGQIGTSRLLSIYTDTSRITPHTINPQHMTTKKDGSTVQDESKANPDVLRKGVPDKEKQYVSFDILRTHSAPLGLIGRATGVYEADMKLKIPKFPVVPCALKLASQPNYRLDPERVLISDLRKALPSWSDHLPEIYYSDIFTPEELGQPSVAFVEKENQRKLHVTASRIYRKLWEVESVKEFQIVWLQCVQCHYLAFKEGKILHRDLSENNLMFWRKPVMNAKPVLTSVLNDWDMASRLTDSAFAPKTATQNRTGTLPFMAVDLLTPTPPDHYYRHDLESFLYILLWAALRYGFNGKRRQLPDVCKRWGGPDLQDALGFKSILNTHAWSRKVILDAIPAEWASVKTAWIVPLLDLFEKARRSKPTSEPVEQPNYDRSTYGGRLTYKTFMEAIGQSNEDPSK